MDEKTIRDLFVTYGTRHEKKKHHFIYDPTVSRSCSEAYYLEEGIAALTSINGNGEETVFLYFNERRIIGFSEILAHKYRFPDKMNQFLPMSAFWLMAKTGCVYYTMKEPVFSRLLDENLVFTSAVLESASLNYLEIINKVQHTQDVSKEILFCEWLLSCHIHVDSLALVPKVFTFTEVAKYLGMHPVTVSRIAARLKKQGLIRRTEDGLVITDEPRLVEIMRTGRKQQEKAVRSVRTAPHLHSHRP